MDIGGYGILTPDNSDSSCRDQHKKNSFPWHIEESESVLDFAGMSDTYAKEETKESTLPVSLDIPYRFLNTGATCPGIGYGMGGEGKETTEELYAAVRAAIDSGYRSFDTAPLYQDGTIERVLGQAIRDSGVDRSEFFVATKIWPTFARKPHKSLELSLNNLGLEYVDCLLLHWPIPLKPVPGEIYAIGSTWDAGWDYKKTWIQMQQLPKSQVKAIGLCNFTVNRLKQLLSSPSTTVVPAVLQVEGHPELSQKNLMNFCRKHSIQVFCYSPLAKNQLHNNVINHIAKQHGVNPAQVAISWAVQRGTVPLPKSVNKDRIRGNIQLVKLYEDDMELLDSLGRHPRRMVNPRLFFGHDIFENNIDCYEDETVEYKDDAHKPNEEGNQRKRR